MKEFNQNYNDLQFMPLVERNLFIDRREAEIEEYNEKIRKNNK